MHILTFFFSIFVENTSDSSDIEQRLLGLEDELETRRLELERMRKKREKELLRLKEQELKKALQVGDRFCFLNFWQGLL